MICPLCSGRGWSEGFAHLESGRCEVRRIDCRLCGGTGKIDGARRAEYDEATRRRDARVDAGRSIREEAARLGVTVRELSDMENYRRPFAPEPC